MENRGANHNCNAGNQHNKSTGSSVVDEEEVEDLTLNAVDEEEVEDLTLNAVNEGKEEDLTLKFPPGYRFCPTDDELIDYYLSNKVNNTPLPPNNFHDVNLYDQGPDQLVAKYKCSGENSWYFFTPRDRKYPNGMRPKRSAGVGYWKATGADRPVVREDGTRVGFRKSLVFYEGKPPKGKKTDWIMHEYRVKDTPETQQRQHGSMRLDNWVLCKIHKKATSEKRLKARSKDEVSVPAQTLALDVDDGDTWLNEKEVLDVALDSNVEHNFNDSNHNIQEGDLESVWSFEHSFNPVGSPMFQQPISPNFPDPYVPMPYPLQWKPCNYGPVQPQNHLTPTEPVITNATENSFQTGPTLEPQNFTPHDQFTPTDPIITNATENNFQTGSMPESLNFTPHNHFTPTEPNISNATANNHQKGQLESQNCAPTESTIGKPSNNYQLKTLSNQWQRHRDYEYILYMQANHDKAFNSNNSLPWKVFDSDEMNLNAARMKKMKCHL